MPQCMALATISMVGTHIPPATCNCYEQKTSSPNGRPAIDSAIIIIANELAEAATYPSGEGWYNAPNSSQCFSAGSVENADQCAWYFPNSTWSSYHYYNLLIGTARYNLQSNWYLSKNACQMAKGNLARFFVVFILFYIPLYCDCYQNLINH
jgi:hypothetical protein